MGWFCACMNIMSIKWNEISLAIWIQVWFTFQYKVILILASNRWRRFWCLCGWRCECGRWWGEGWGWRAWEWWGCIGVEWLLILSGWSEPSHPRCSWTRWCLIVLMTLCCWIEWGDGIDNGFDYFLLYRMLHVICWLDYLVARCVFVFRMFRLHWIVHRKMFGKKIIPSPATPMMPQLGWRIHCLYTWQEIAT